LTVNARLAQAKSSTRHGQKIMIRSHTPVVSGKGGCGITVLRSPDDLLFGALTGPRAAANSTGLRPEGTPNGISFSGCTFNFI
jgi:hypothetical protein